MFNRLAILKVGYPERLVLVSLIGVPMSLGTADKLIVLLEMFFGADVPAVMLGTKYNKPAKLDLHLDEVNQVAGRNIYCYGIVKSDPDPLSKAFINEPVKIRTENEELEWGKLARSFKQGSRLSPKQWKRFKRLMGMLPYIKPPEIRF